MNKILKLFGYLLLFFFLIVAYVFVSSSGLIGNLPQDYEVIEFPRPQLEESVNANQIFFGDLHVHTTFSQDAFLFSLPVIQGEGAHPPADACNFARFCSSLDFFSITDHAEGLTKEMWQDTINSIKNCDNVSNEEGLRYYNEPVRHKILDCMGDIFMAGFRINGKVIAYKSGHELNNKLMHTLFSDNKNWSISPYRSSEIFNFENPLEPMAAIA